MTITALILLADGAEEMETVITADVLRRAKIKVTIAGVSGPMAVKCSRDVVIVPDVPLGGVYMVKFDLVIIPGGNPNSGKLLGESSLVKEVLTEQDESGRLIGAICAGPLVFINHGIAKGKTVTSYPAMQAALEEAGYKYSTKRVCTDGNIITSRGPGTATEFAFACASAALGTDFKAEHGPAMLLNF